MTWREGDAAQLDDRVSRLDELLDKLEDHEAWFEHDRDEKAATEIRGFAALIRSRRIDVAARARDLRATPALTVLPMALTTRRVRS